LPPLVSGEAHFRRKRTLDLLCGSEQFANALARTLLDESRPLLGSAEPLVLGDGPTWRDGSVVLRHGRLWGASTAHLKGPVLLRCDDVHMRLGVHIALNNSDIAYDWEARELPFLGPRGTVRLFSRQLALETLLELPRGRLTPVRALDIRLSELQGADVHLTGPWPYAPIVSGTVNMVLRSFPDMVRDLVAKPLRDALQQYLDQQQKRM
ncbi:unnamed protein product, partial [Ixodes hexagonus]